MEASAGELIILQKNGGKNEQPGMYFQAGRAFFSAIFEVSDPVCYCAAEPSNFAVSGEGK